MFLFVTALACVVVHFFLTFFVARNKVGSCSSPRHSEEFPFLPAPTACLAAVCASITLLSKADALLTECGHQVASHQQRQVSQQASKDVINQSIKQAGQSVVMPSQVAVCTRVMCRVNSLKK